MASRSLDDMKSEPGKIRELVTAVYSKSFEHLSEQELLVHFWQSLNPTFPPIDPKVVDWLVLTSDSAGDSGLLATYALNPTWAGFPKGYWRNDEGRILYEAFRILVRAAARRPPRNIGFLWQQKDGIIYPDLDQYRLKTLSLLCAGWSGVSRSRDLFFKTCLSHLEPNLFPAGDGWALFERLLRDYPLGDLGSHEGNPETLSVQGAFVAWKEGKWTPKTLRSLLDAAFFDSNVLSRLQPKQFHTSDSSFIKFIDVCAEVSRKTVDLLIDENELELAANKFRGVQPSQSAIDIVLKIGRAIEANSESQEMISLISPLKVPSGDSVHAIEQLKQLDSKTLLAFTQEQSEWIPLILEAIPDRKLAEFLKSVIGAFCDDLLPAELTGFTQRITYPTLHPGKAASGFTNLQPFFERLTVTPLSVIKKALPIIRRSNCCREDAPHYITHYLGLPPSRRPKQRLFYQDEWFVELSRRIPLGSADSEILVSQRMEAISLTYFEYCARKTTASAPTYGVLRAVMCAHAESSGFPSTETALLDAARHWAAKLELVRDGLTLRKCSNTPEGIILMKGKRAIQNLPPALKKDPEITRFRAEAFSLWQTRLLFEAEVMPHYFETGEFLDNSGFYDVFGCQATDTLRRRLETSIPEKFEKEFRTALEAQSITEHHFTCIPPFNPAEALPELIRRGWEDWLGNGDYKGFYFTTGEDDGEFIVPFRIVSVDPHAHFREGITPPATPHTLALSNGRGRSAPPDYTSAFHQRVIGIVMRDLVDALPSVT